MAINFPDSPVSGDSFTANNKTWVFDGTVWNITFGTNSIADGSITTAKILDANVTQAKLGTTLSAVTVTTAANRDTAVASPFTGQLVFLTDTKKIQVWDGTSWLNITLAPPETPTSLSATALSVDSVSIAFTAGGANGSPITNYKYALSTDSGSTYGSFTALSPAEITSPITISGLAQNTAYYIKLKAVNDMGDSVASAAVSITTLNLASAPTSLSATPAATTVDIAFTPGDQAASAITNYQYALSTDSGSTYGSFTALATPDATSPITVDGLTAGTAYYIKLKAVNTEGAGAESSAVSFTTIATLTVDYLVVAGGSGGGGEWSGAGGGAGGLRSTVTATGGGGSLETALTLLLSTNYTVTIGAGSAGATTVLGANGSDSVFDTITSLGGGAANTGGGAIQPASGGSGGGGSSYVPREGGAGTANQGFAGGSGGPAPIYSNGGGGGAGAAGSSQTGGAGVAVSITGSSVTYAGGGGGSSYDGGAGSGGSGGGGNANRTGVATAGTANLGGGGGGSGSSVGAFIGAAGGSGVVILRYLTADGTITIGAGLTGSTTTSGGDTIATITAGSGNVSWA